MTYKILGYAHAYCGKDFNAGGETTIHDLFRRLVADGFEVNVLLSEKQVGTFNSDYELDGVNVIAFTDELQLNRLARKHDLVISHLGGSQRASIVAKNLKKPSLHIIHNDLDWTKGVAQHANYLVYNTLWVMDSFRNDKVIRPPGMVVHPPVDPDRYRVRSRGEHITLVNLTDGDGSPYDKGSRVFYHLAERFPEQKFLGVVGSYGKQDIRDLPNVTIVPNTNDIKSIYRQSRIILSPSNYESYGRVSLEAAASGIPSITSEAPGFAEHGIAFRQVDFRDFAGWEAALSDLLKPSVRQKASREARCKLEAIWQKSQGELAEFSLVCRQLCERTRTKAKRRR